MLLHPDSTNLLKNSRKRFNSIELFPSHDIDQEHIKLLELVGKDVKNLEIDGYAPRRIDSNLASLLKLMPNLEAISLGGDKPFKQTEEAVKLC